MIAPNVLKNSLIVFCTINMLQQVFNNVINIIFFV